jgi:hypothetical protein
MIWLDSENVRHLPTPFGGMKASGIGRDGGDYSFDFYIVVISGHWPSGRHRAINSAARFRSPHRWRPCSAPRLPLHRLNIWRRKSEPRCTKPGESCQACHRHRHRRRAPSERASPSLGGHISTFNDSITADQRAVEPEVPARTSAEVGFFVCQQWGAAISYRYRSRDRERQTCFLVATDSKGPRYGLGRRRTRQARSPSSAAWRRRVARTGSPIFVASMDDAKPPAAG